MWSKRNVNRTCAWIPALSCHVMSCHLICLWLGGCSWSCVLSVILHFSTDGVFRILTRTKRVFLETVVTCLLTVSKKQTSFGPSGTEVRRANRIGLHLYNVVLYKPLTRCRVVELFWVFGQQRTFDVTPSHTRSTYTEEEKKKTEVWLRISATHTVELMLVAVPHNTSVSRSPERAPSPYPYWPMSTSVFRLNAGSCTTSS